MGYPERVQVEPARLTAVAAEVTEAATLLGTALSSAQGRLEPSCQDGWALAGAARTAQESWTTFLTSLGQAVSGLAGELRAAADGYTQSDQAAADRIGADRIGAGRTRPM